MNALPITFKAYWFVSVYILLYLFHPYINKLLNNLDRKEHLSFIWLMFIIFSILRTILMADYYGNELIQFLLFYTIGAYLYKYPDNILGRNKNNIKIMISSVFVILGSIIILEYLGINNEWIAANSTHLLSRTSPIAILFCVGLFDWASRKQHYSSKIINGISSWVFGVYLISDNMYLRPIIWDGIFKTKEYVSSSWLVLHMLVAVVLVTVICLLIDAVRKRFIEKPFFSVFDKLIDGFQEKQKKNN